MIRFLAMIVFLFPSLLYSQIVPLPSDVQAVCDYIAKEECLELFDTLYYRVRIVDFLTCDIDSDGTTEVIINTIPHYRQSATILFYRVIDGKVKRITEGLAPGLLHRVSGDYLDSHNLGSAADMIASNAKTSEPIDVETLFRGAKESGLGGVVIYNSFFHTDSRKGSLFFLDMRHIDSIIGNPYSCEGFEFATVRQILVGNYGKITNCLFALTSDGVYIYKIHSISPEGRIIKTTYVYRPNYVICSMESTNGAISAVDEKGQKHLIE